MQYRFFIGILFLCLASCKQSDNKLIIGKWQNEQDWFHFKNDTSYNSGKEMIKMVDNFKYTIDSKDKALNLYTNDKNSTFYLHYEFIGTDTLAVYNLMSSNKRLIKFYRVKEETISESK